MLFKEAGVCSENARNSEHQTELRLPLKVKNGYTDALLVFVNFSLSEEVEPGFLIFFLYLKYSNFFKKNVSLSSDLLFFCSKLGSCSPELSYYFDTFLLQKKLC